MTSKPFEVRPFPLSRCVRCGVPILCIPPGGGMWVHEADTPWGYSDALCGKTKRGVLLTAKPRKQDRLR